MSPIHFREMGKGHTLIFIHGFCETSEIWQGFAEKFSNDFRVITLDLPGFGHSPLPETPFTLKDIAQNVYQTLQEQSIGRYSLVGHSLGGYVCLALARLYPEQCQSLVLFHSTALGDTPEKKENRNKVIEFVLANGVLPFVQTFVPGLFHDKNHLAISRAYSIAHQTKPETLVSYTEAMRDRPSQVSFLESFGKPKLLIGGEFDPIIPPAALTEIADLTRTELQILPGTAHMGMYEAPAMSYQILSNFLFKAVTHHL